jgi:hypothetical protein
MEPRQHVAAKASLLPQPPNAMPMAAQVIILKYIMSTVADTFSVASD